MVDRRARSGVAVFFLLRSGGSILLVVIWHGTYNLISGTAAGTRLLAATATSLVIVLAICLVGLELRARHQGRGTVVGPRQLA